MLNASCVVHVIAPVQMHFCIWRAHPKLMHEALYEYTRLQLGERNVVKPRSLAQQLVVWSLVTTTMPVGFSVLACQQL